MDHCDWKRTEGTDTDAVAMEAVAVKEVVAMYTVAVDTVVKGDSSCVDLCLILQ